MLFLRNVLAEKEKEQKLLFLLEDQKREENFYTPD